MCSAGSPTWASWEWADNRGARRCGLVHLRNAGKGHAGRRSCRCCRGGGAGAQPHRDGCEVVGDHRSDRGGSCHRAVRPRSAALTRRGHLPTTGARRVVIYPPSGHVQVTTRQPGPKPPPRHSNRVGRCESQSPASSSALALAASVSVVAPSDSRSNTSACLRSLEVWSATWSANSSSLTPLPAGSTCLSLLTRACFRFDGS